MIGICDTPTISQQDVIEAVQNWQERMGEENTQLVLDFASELTGLSVDKIVEHL